jgi:phosphate uptake regulator
MYQNVELAGMVVAEDDRSTGDISKPISPPKDKDILDAIERMGRLTRSLLCQPKESFAERNVATSQDLVRQHAEINRLNGAISTRAVEIGHDLELREWAMFMVLVARAIERIADNTSTSPGKPHSS